MELPRSQIGGLSYFGGNIRLETKQNVENANSRLNDLGRTRYDHTYYLSRGQYKLHVPSPYYLHERRYTQVSDKANLCKRRVHMIIDKA